MFSRFILSIAFFSCSVFASYEEASKIYGHGSISLSGYRRTIMELVQDGYYYSTLPWMKDYLVKVDGPLDNSAEESFDKMIYATGIRPFETLPESVLKRSKAGNIRYILAKRLFKNGKLNEALNELERIEPSHSVYPFSSNMKGAVYASLKNSKASESSYRECIRSSDEQISESNSFLEKKQLMINRDYCLVGIARSQFGSTDYKKAELIYLDVSKDSFVWPEILFEEAWTSYYLKNYNRTLGKLITYKAPMFDFVFKPEVEVLKALTYLQMCLYDDAKKTVDNFYDELLNPSRNLRQFLTGHGKDYKFYYHLMADYEDNKKSELAIVDHILNSIRKDAAYLEMKGALTSSLAEYNQLRKRGPSTMRSNLLKNIKVTMDEYRTLIGAYVRASFVSKYGELYSAFQGMSYIKLEVLAQRKERLYQSPQEEGKKRGDVKYIERNDKQYFWNFNGEFWADELGDYVFALRSEC
ncbi:MAG: hypothetical protein AB7I27_05620 [Bacteriovoracaceae bacterium]